MVDTPPVRGEIVLHTGTDIRQKGPLGLAWFDEKIEHLNLQPLMAMAVTRKD
jgi:hypothetical protein